MQSSLDCHLSASSALSRQPAKANHTPLCSSVGIQSPPKRHSCLEEGRSLKVGTVAEMGMTAGFVPTGPASVLAATCTPALSQLSVCQPLSGDYVALFVHVCVYSVNICKAEESVGTRVTANSEQSPRLRASRLPEPAPASGQRLGFPPPLPLTWETAIAYFSFLRDICLSLLPKC